MADNELWGISGLNRLLPHKFHFSANQCTRAGVRAWGDITMAHSEKWKEQERRDQVARYRVLARETTDPLAAGLLRDIVSDLEDELNELSVDERRTATGDQLPELGLLEFHGQTVSCLIRSLSEHGAALDLISPRDIPDRFMLAIPLDGRFHRCHLIWRRRAEIGVTFR